jgi:ABC-type branched-subunit amino acid transport system ATPase component
MSAIQVKNLMAGYGSTQVINGVNFSVDPGQAISIFGHNGVGKSTLLKALMGLLKNHDGEVFINGQLVSKMPTHLITKQGVSYAAQEHAIFPEHTVEDNLKIAARFAGYADFEPLFEIFPRIKARMAQRVDTLSGGEHKMLLAVRTLGTARTVAILDEIVEGVQPSYLKLFQEGIIQAKSRGVSIVMVEQHVGFSLPIAENFLVMERGTIVESGKVDEGTPGVLEKYLTI